VSDDTGFVYVRERSLPFETFDADNHMYENRDALTKFIPREYDGIIKYVDVAGRTKLAIRDVITDFIPNPTFSKVFVPGGYGEDITKGGDGHHRPGDEKKRIALMASPGAFFDPEPRLRLMKDMGIDRTLLWPTLAHGIEPRLADDPDAVCVVVHALNEWMHEHWTFAYADAIFATPLISLSVLDRAIEELEYVYERGARVFLLRVAPVPTWKGLRSFALPEFDPFWERVQELDVLVGMHVGDAGYTRYTNEWEGLSNREFRPFSSNGAPAFLRLSSDKSVVVDAMASIIGHGLATRFPRLKFFPVEINSEWIRPFAQKLQRAYSETPQLFLEDPFEVFTRNVWVHAFHEPDPQGLIDAGLPTDHIMFGSDFPHAEGMADPVAYSEVVAGMPLEAQEYIMGGSIAKVMRVGKYSAQGPRTSSN
jgi:predicted TIM-barrel fold metal-dependent hydrolase